MAAVASSPSTPNTVSATTGAPSSGPSGRRPTHLRQLTLSAVPRPLQLADGSGVAPGTPTDSPNPSSSPNARRRQNRFSSISYSPSPRSPPTFSAQLDQPPTPRPQQVRSQTLNAQGEERAPITLAEKHADLLRFIAQKESKCQELRQALAQHEAELAALKSKWERIVSKGSPHPTTQQSTTTTGNNPSPPSSTIIPSTPTSLQAFGNLGNLAGSGADDIVSALRQGSKGIGKLLNIKSNLGLATPAPSPLSPPTDLPSPPASDSSATSTISSVSLSEKSSSSSSSVDESQQALLASSELKSQLTGVKDILPQLRGKWEEIQKSDAFTTSTKRASTLLSDVSSSFFAVLAPPTTTPGPAKRKSSLMGSRKPRLVATRLVEIPKNKSLSQSKPDDTEAEQEHEAENEGALEEVEALLDFGEAASPALGKAEAIVEEAADDDQEGWNWGLVDEPEPMESS